MGSMVADGTRLPLWARAPSRGRQMPTHPAADRPVAGGWPSVPV